MDKISFAHLGGNRGATKINIYNIDEEESLTSMTSIGQQVSEEKNRIDTLALRLANKLNDIEGIKYYYKVCWAYPYPILERLAATAIELGRNPGAYFNALVKKELENA